MTPPLILTGMHRSGTSLVASLLPTLGIDLGQHLIPADFRNPCGYYEDVDFVRLQQAMLHHCLPSEDGGWPDWGWTESEIFNVDQLDAFHPQAARLLQPRAQTGQWWGWKDPRTSLLLDFWDQACRETLQTEARYLLLYRFPWEVADSVQRLADATFLRYPSYAYRIWLCYNRRLLAFYLQHQDRCLLVSTNALLAAVERLPALLQDKLGLPCPTLPPSALAALIAPTLFVSPTAREAQVALVSQLYPATLTLLQELDQAADLSSQGQWPASATFPLATLPSTLADRYLTQLLDAHREQNSLRQEVIFLRQRVHTLQLQTKGQSQLGQVARRAKNALPVTWRKTLGRVNAKLRFALEPALIPRTAAIDQSIHHLLEEERWPAAGLNLNIAKDDLMYRYALQHKGDPVAAYCNYLRIGIRAAALIKASVAAQGRTLASLGALLDFAGGYGRVTRCLVQVLPPERIWIADIKAAAVQFQQQHFGVHSLLSTWEPAAFMPAQRFDCIFVGSLFSHLPEPLFHGWLQQLYQLLTPGGLLIFSVHDQRLMPTAHAAATAPGSGKLLFSPHSEETQLAVAQPPLPPAYYGVAYVDETFVRQAVQRLQPSPTGYLCKPGAWAGQDLYTLCKTP